MSIRVRCGRRMDGSGPSCVFSSPNFEAAEVTDAPSLEPISADDRPALPPGHPLSWGLLTLGTLLEGSPYANTL